jgi:hypothetical protein
MRAMAGAINTFLTSVLGIGLGPFCVGYLSDILAPTLGAQSLRYALVVPICLLPTLVVALYSAGNSFPDDLRRAGAFVGLSSGMVK